MAIATLHACMERPLLFVDLFFVKPHTHETLENKDLDVKLAARVHVRVRISLGSAGSGSYPCCRLDSATLCAITQKRNKVEVPPPPIR